MCVILKQHDWGKNRKKSENLDVIQNNNEIEMEQEIRCTSFPGLDPNTFKSEYFMFFINIYYTCDIDLLHVICVYFGRFFMLVFLCIYFSSRCVLSPVLDCIL